MAKKKKIEKHIHTKIVKPKAVPIPNWHIPLILIITFIIYIPALSAGFVNWDDPDYVGGNNFLIRDLSRLPELLTTPVQGNYHPLTMFSLALNFAISGENEWSYHLFNIIFHLINCFLVYRLAYLLSKNNPLVALVTSLLFAIHPLHVESVAWISERKDVLYALFFIAGHISYTKYIDTSSKKQYWLTLLFVVLSLMSKPAAVIFPVSLFCIDILRRRQFSFKLITEKILFFIPAVGATGEEYFGLAKNILFGFYGIMMYFVKMIIPFKLSAFYPFPPLNEKLSAAYYVAPIFALLLAAVTYFSWKKYRFVAFGICFYIANLLLVLQIFSVGSAVIAERYTYVPYIGLFFIAGYLLDRFAKGNLTKAYAVLAPVTIIFSVLSFLQVRTWKSGETLWDTVIKNQPCSRAYSARATLFRRDANQLKAEADQAKNAKKEQEANLKYAEANKNYQQAINYYTEAVKINAIDHESYNNRANIYMDLNNFNAAILDYKQALVVKPDYYVALDNMGALYARRGMFDSALYYFSEVLRQKPDYKPTYSNRAITFMSLKRYDEAIKDWQRFLSYQPNDADVTNTIGECYRMLGKNQEALGFINTAIQLDPQPAFFLNRSYTYKNLNNIDNARNDALTAKKAGIQLDAAFAASLGIQ
ncbi:MAG: tetratricopeptide repeat protein [Bacteroidetes bacterium]|nr:MAG: tetratricopeptide repeat protein [Bacteroidota bacterium]